MKKNKLPRILIADIETAPLSGFFWQLFDQTIPLNMIKVDWHLLSYSAKWLDSKEIFYEDQRNIKNIEDDSKLLKGIWKLMDEADIIVGQNIDRFDIKKLNARFILNGMQPPSSYRTIDTLKIAKKKFAFTSNKLEYLSENLCTKHKKSKHKKYSGFELWKACMIGDKDAWKEMEHYNKMDVLSTEEVYKKLIPWDNTININVYHDLEDTICSCGSTNFAKNGYAYTSSGKFQRHKCRDCGAEIRNRNNELSKEKKQSLKK